MKRCLSILLCLGLVYGCSSSDPDAVAEKFWKAGQQGDTETVNSLVSKDSQANFESDDRPPFETITVGEVVVDGEAARVDTQITIENDEEPMNVAFDTFMVLEDGEWKVDLDATMIDMTKEIIAMSMKAIGAQFGDAMKDVTKGMAEGISEFGKSLQEFADELEEVE